MLRGVENFLPSSGVLARTYGTKAGQNIRKEPKFNPKIAGIAVAVMGAVSIYAATHQNIPKEYPPYQDD